MPERPGRTPFRAPLRAEHVCYAISWTYRASHDEECIPTERIPHLLSAEVFLFRESGVVNPLSLRTSGFSAPSYFFRLGPLDEFGNVVVNDSGDEVHIESVVGSVSGRMV